MLGSALFEEGFDEGVFSAVDSPTLEGGSDLESEIELTRVFLKEVYTFYELVDGDFVAQFGKFVEKAQQLLKGKEMMINYGGEVGLNCVKSCFLLYLRHNGQLQSFI